MVDEEMKVFRIVHGFTPISEDQEAVIEEMRDLVAAGKRIISKCGCEGAKVEEEGEEPCVIIDDPCLQHSPPIGEG